MIYLQYWVANYKCIVLKFTFNTLIKVLINKEYRSRCKTKLYVMSVYDNSLHSLKTHYTNSHI